MPLSLWLGCRPGEVPLLVLLPLLRYGVVGGQKISLCKVAIGGLQDMKNTTGHCRKCGHTRLLVDGAQQGPPSVGDYAKGIFNYPPPETDPVVVYPLFWRHAAPWKKPNQPQFQRESIIRQEETRHLFVSQLGSKCSRPRSSPSACTGRRSGRPE